MTVPCTRRSLYGGRRTSFLAIPQGRLCRHRLFFCSKTNGGIFTFFSLSHSLLWKRNSRRSLFFFSRMFYAQNSRAIAPPGMVIHAVSGIGTCTSIHGAANMLPTHCRVFPHFLCLLPFPDDEICLSPWRQPGALLRQAREAACTVQYSNRLA